MMNAVINISRKDLAVSKTLHNFAVHNRQDIVSDLQIGYTANTAALLWQVYFGILDGCAKLYKGVAFFVSIHNQTFIPKMHNRDENLSWTAIGASSSTANVRKLVTSKTQQLSPTLYRITMQLFAPITGADGRTRRCGISHTADCCASSEREAIGLALISARAKYRAFDGINARSVILS